MPRKKMCSTRSAWIHAHGRQLAENRVVLSASAGAVRAEVQRLVGGGPRGTSIAAAHAADAAAHPVGEYASEAVVGIGERGAKAVTGSC